MPICWARRGPPPCAAAGSPLFSTRGRTACPRLEQQMDAAEAAVREIRSVEDALRLTIQIESSEVNEVFPAALAATDATW